MTGSLQAAGGLEQERIALVPVGSTDQHGPAGVPGVDSCVAITLAEDVAQGTGVPCTPPIWFGGSTRHAGELELAHVHHRIPGSVRTDRLTDAGVDFQQVFGGFVGDDLLGPAPDGVDIIWSGDEQRRFTPTGSFSSSLGLGEDKGRRYHDHIVVRRCELVEWLRTYDGPVGTGPVA